jgi:hypothetical protein
MSKIGFLTYPVLLKWIEWDFQTNPLLFSDIQFQKYTILSQNDWDKQNGPIVNGYKWYILFNPVNLILSRLILLKHHKYC